MAGARQFLLALAYFSSMPSVLCLRAEGGDQLQEMNIHNEKREVRVEIEGPKLMFCHLCMLSQAEI